MNQPFRLLIRTVFLGALLTAIGCGGSVAPPPMLRPLDTRAPGQYFKEQQSATMTPNGKIMIDTVIERDGKIEYATEDGKRWA